MKRYFREGTLLAVFVSMSVLVSAQVYDSVLKKLDTQFPQEKLYLQFDKSAYNPGETIWFKAYLLASNYPSDISHTVYAELIDDKGKVIQKKSAPIFRYGAAGAFDIPSDLNSSYVYVRAYTRWMLNFDSSFLFLKGFPLLQIKKQNTKPVAVQQAYFLQFFPEGGDLVEGVESRVAFKGTDVNGYPIAVAGEIQTSKGKKVSDIKSMHDGMGYFTLIPDAGEQYIAKWKDPKGETHQTNLPAAKKEGAVLQVNLTQDAIQFTVRRSPGLNSSTTFDLVAQMQQQLLYRAKANLSVKSEVSGQFPKTNLSSGIVQITLFSGEGKPLAERIVFVNQQDYYFITDLNAPLKNLTERGKNVIQIDVPDTILTNLSIAVTDADVNPEIKDDDDIFSSVLLTSDIKGFVYHPGYYFSSDADSVAKHLDLVMMTNGWRRFKWDDVLANHWPEIKYTPDAYMGIKGTIRGLNKTDLRNRDLTAIVQPKGGAKQFVSLPITPEGNFELGDMLLFDSVKIYYQLNDDKNKVLTTRANFDFTTNLMKEYLGLPLPMKEEYYVVKPDSISMARNKLAAQKNFDPKKVQTLATVQVTARQKTKAEKLDGQYASGLFSGGDANSFVPDDDPAAMGAQNVFTYLQGRVAGLQISMNGGEPSLSWRGGSPSLFLDEMQQQDASMLETIPMSNVALIKVFRPPFFGATGGGANGAIAVYTKKGSSMNQDVKGLDFVNIAGYSPMKEFYSPDYDKDPANDHYDYRTTLYWNPYVLTDKSNRRIRLTFFNNDFTKRIRVVVEGLNNDGKLTKIEKIFN
jgi:hypothetical protein